MKIIKHHLKILIIISLLVLSFPFLITAQSDAGISNRIQRDDEQTKTEVEILADLQRQDYEQCVAEASGFSPLDFLGGGGGSGATTNNTPSQPGSGWNQIDETKTRDELASAGVSINKNPCQGKNFRTVSGGCTDVAGLPQPAINRLKEVGNEIGGFTLTGGTEAGHSSHGIGNSVVDVGLGNSNFNRWVSQNTISTSYNSKGEPVYKLRNGDIITRESDHYHWRINNNSSQQASLEKNWSKTPKQILAQIKDFILLSVQAATTQSSITIGDRLVDITQTSSVELENLLSKLTKDEINNLFSGLSSANTRTILNKLPFSGLNDVIYKLDENNINRAISSLSRGDFNQLINNLIPGGDGTAGTIDHLLNNLNAGNLTNLINNLSNDALGTVFSSLGQNSLETVLNQLSGGLINDVFGRLGQGSINNIFNQLSGDLINKVVGDLGMTSLNRIFQQVSDFGMDTIFGNLNSGILSNILPSLGSGSLSNIINTATSGVLNTALEKIPSEIVTDIASRLPNELVKEIPALGDALSSAGIDFGGALDSLGGGLGSVVGLVTGSGLYVPVVEQNGRLMQLTTSIDKTEKQIKDLSVQICTHLKAIRRIQTRFEMKEFTAEVAATRARASAIQAWRNALVGEDGWFRTGGKDSKNKSSPLFVVNITNYIAGEKSEAEEKTLVDIEKSENLYKQEILADIIETENTPIPFNSTLSQEDLNKIFPNNNTVTANNASQNFTITNIPIIGRLARPFIKLASLFGANPSFAADPSPANNSTSASEKWDILLKLTEPQNNFNGSLVMAINQLDRSRAVAEMNALNTYNAGQGFLPTRECVKWESVPSSNNNNNQVCLEWKTIVPASINKDSYFSALNATRDQYVSDPKMGGTGEDEGPKFQENATGKTETGSGGAPGPGSITSVNQVPVVAGEIRSTNINNYEPPTQTETGGSIGGGQTGQTNLFDWRNFTSLYSLLMHRQNPPSSSGLDNLFNLFNQLLSFYNNMDPLVYFEKVNLNDNQFRLYWASPNSSNCISGNDWLSYTATSSLIIKSSGGALEKYDNLVITLPVSNLSIPSQIDYQLTCRNNNGENTEKVIIRRQ